MHLQVDHSTTREGARGQDRPAMSGGRHIPPMDGVHRQLGLTGPGRGTAHHQEQVVSVPLRTDTTIATTAMVVGSLEETRETETVTPHQCVVNGPNEHPKM